MKKIIVSAFILLATLTAAAETINGSVINEKGEAMPFVTISVLTQDSSLITGTITNDDGTFDIKNDELKTNNYILQASYVGYQTVFGGPDFVLREETEHLATVEVKAKKPLIERQMDKLVVNVSASPLAAGSNGNEILRRRRRWIARGRGVPGTGRSSVYALLHDPHDAEKRLDAPGLSGVYGVPAGGRVADGYGRLAGWRARQDEAPLQADDPPAVVRDPGCGGAREGIRPEKASRGTARPRFV